MINSTLDKYQDIHAMFIGPMQLLSSYANVFIFITVFYVLILPIYGTNYLMKDEKALVILHKEDVEEKCSNQVGVFINSEKKVFKTILCTGLTSEIKEQEMSPFIIKFQNEKQCYLRIKYKIADNDIWYLGIDGLDLIFSAEKQLFMFTNGNIWTRYGQDRILRLEIIQIGSFKNIQWTEMSNTIQESDFLRQLKRREFVDNLCSLFQDTLIIKFLCLFKMPSPSDLLLLFISPVRASMLLVYYAMDRISDVKASLRKQWKYSLGIISKLWFVVSGAYQLFLLLGKIWILILIWMVILWVGCIIEGLNFLCNLL